jgi:MoaA/NifB/PqqE/SkfB family radical SAM enzyme
MDYRLYETIIDGLREFKKPIKTVRLYGFGEPLLNSKFCDMVRYAKRSDNVLSVDTTTNGILLNPRLNEDLIESGIDRINISINGIGGEQYKQFTGRDVDFQALIRNIEHLYSIRGKTVIFVKTCGDYMSELDQKFFKEIFTPISDGCDIEHTMSCWYDMDIEKNEEVGVYGQPRENVAVCPYIFYSFMIHADGKASLCFLDWDKRMIIGDARIQTARHIWNDLDLRSYRVESLLGESNSICANCDQLRAGMPVKLDEHAAEILKKI